MPADTTVVIAACLRFPEDSELSYTAAVVQCVENLTDCEDYSLKFAKATFLEKIPRVWFRGIGALARAKQFANLLAQEQRANGVLSYEDRPIIEIGADSVYLLSRKGKRKTKEVPIRSGGFEFHRIRRDLSLGTAFGERG